MIKQITLSTGETLFVEVENLDIEMVKPLQKETSNNLPKGSRLTSAESESTTAAEYLKAQLEGLAKISLDALKDLKPDEVKIEAHIGFAGDVKIIPFIASAKSDGGLKISLTWKNSND